MLCPPLSDPWSLPDSPVRTDAAGVVETALVSPFASKLASRSVAAGLAWILVLLFWLLDILGHGLPARVDRIAVLAALVATAVWLGALLVRRVSGRKGRDLALALLLPALIMLSLAVRFTGLSHEVEGRYYADEGTYYHHASKIVGGQPLRLSFVYPHLMYYADALVLWLASLFPGVVAGWAGLVGVTEPLGVSWLVLRSVVGLLSALTVLPVFRIGEWMGGVWAGALGSLLLILSPLYNEGSHLNICDVPSAFFAAVCLFFVARLVEEERTADYLLAGVAAGLAAGSKYPAGLVAVAVVAVWIRWRIARRDLRLGLLWAGLAAIAAFLLVMPSLVIFPEAAFEGRRGVFFGARQYGRGGWLGVMPRSNVAAYTEDLAWSFGLPALLAGLSGLGLYFAAGRERRRWLWLAAYPVAYLTLISSMHMVVKRNLYPAIPILAVFLGVGIAACVERLARLRQPGLRAALAAGLAAVCLWLPADRTARQAIGLASPSTREVAADWIRENVPRGASIAKESYTPNFPEGEYEVLHRRFVTRLSLAELRRFDYVLVANAAYLRFQNPAALTRPHQRQMAERYREIFRSFELVKEWPPTDLRTGPVVRLYRPKPSPPWPPSPVRPPHPHPERERGDPH